jgi:elongation factor G
MHANHREEREHIMAGENRSDGGPQGTTTGDTLATDTAPIRLESMDFPEPVISSRSSRRRRATRTSWAPACSVLTEEDPTFRVRTDEETGQTLISGMGELHLEIIVDRLTREFNVDANVGRPQVAYRETSAGRSRRSRDASSARPAAVASTATP